MPGLKLRTRLALAAIASAAAAFALAGTAAANPIGPCEEVLFVGVCAPLSEQPSPPAQQSREEVFLPDANSGIQVVN